MQQKEVEISVLKHQIAFIESNHIHTGLVAGFGAGKSKAATFKCLDKLEMFYRLNNFKKGINVAYYLPTYPLIKGIAFDNFSHSLEERGIPFVLNETDKEFVTPIGKLIMRSMDNPGTIVGYEVGYSLIDEADILPLKKMKKAFTNIVARNRKFIPGDLPNCLDMVSTPEGFNFMYDFFVKKPSDNKIMIKASTYDNPYLPDSYIPTLKESYSEQEIEAYLNGEFVNLTAGNVYHCFSRSDNHSTREIKEKDVLHIGMDFNITQMSAVIHVVDGKVITAVEEITKAYDTADMISILNSRYPKHKKVIYPDASGENRKTNASDTDISLLRKARYIVRKTKSNPRVRDRITTVNAGFKNAQGERTYMVNTNNCVEYTEALEKLPYKNGLPDKESGFDHVTDGGGYAFYRIKNLTSKRSINV